MTSESNSLGLTRRRVASAALLTGIASAGAGAGTFAYFSDSETLDAGATETFDAALTFNFDAGNDYQGASITAEHTSHLLQDTS